MSRRNRCLFVWVVVSSLTLLLLVASDTGEYTDGGLLITWLGFSWNFYAYGYERGMWPRGFVELDGHGKGHPLARKAAFWLTAAVYLALLATIAWA